MWTGYVGPLFIVFSRFVCSRARRRPLHFHRACSSVLTRTPHSHFPVSVWIGQAGRAWRGDGMSCDGMAGIRMKEISTRRIRPCLPEVDLNRVVEAVRGWNPEWETGAGVRVHDDGLMQYTLCDSDSHHRVPSSLPHPSTLILRRPFSSTRPWSWARRRSDASYRRTSPRTF